MSKNYLCKNCINNNNGWCNVRKINGLKGISQCELHQEEIILNEYLKEVRNEKYKNSGKREMFYYIQREVLAINATYDYPLDKWEALKKSMIRFEKMRTIEEDIHGIVFDSVIDEDIYESSKKINKYLEDKENN